MYFNRKIPTFREIVLPVSSWKKQTKHGTDTDGGKGELEPGALQELMGVRGTV
jgi:hypothetical protein